MNNDNISDTEVFVPKLLVPFVKCTAGHPICGLFIIIRPVVESSKILDRLFRLEPCNFTLGFTDQSGHLSLCLDDDPWPNYYKPTATPNAIKVLADQSYECYFIRHPDPNIAHKALAELNSIGSRDFTKDWQPVVKTFAIESSKNEKNEDIQELVLTLEEQSSIYYPKGSSRYGDWVLYADMPHVQCPAVMKEVKKLQLDLGKMRYIVGDHEPYVPEPPRPDRRNKITNPTTINVGVFDSRTLNGVYVFQKNASSGNGFRVFNGKDTFEKAGEKESIETSLAYLQGSKSEIDPIEVKTDGVVDDLTGDAIANWLDNGIRNPGRILVQMRARELKNPDWTVWVGEEAAQSLYAWRELTKALGFSSGIQANHTYRGILVDVGHADYGRSARSIHKVSLAVDTGLAGNYYDVDANWPIFYTRDNPVEKKSKGIVIGHRIYWRLYAISTLQLTTANGIEECLKRLMNASQDQHILAESALHKCAEKIISEINQDPDKFLRDYFKDKIEEWQYDPWDDHGGRPGSLAAPAGLSKTRLDKLNNELDALEKEKLVLEARILELKNIPPPLKKEQKGELKNKSNQLNQNKTTYAEKKKERDNWNVNRQATKFIDLTLLGEMAGLSRIGSFTNLLKPTGSDWGLAARSIRVYKFSELAKALASVKADHPKLAIEVKGLAVTIERIDTDFMTAWASTLAELKLCREIPPRVTSSLSRDKKGKGRTEQLRSALAKFSDKVFRRVETDELKTGKEWDAEIQAKQEDVDNNAAPVLKDKSKASTKKQKMELTYTLLPTFGSADNDLGLIEFFPNKTIHVPAPGSPIGMEWWHFQRTDLLNGRSFGSMLEELGWTRITLWDKRSETLYYRSGAGYPESELDARAG